MRIIFILALLLACQPASASERHHRWASQRCDWACQQTMLYFSTEPTGGSIAKIIRVPPELEQRCKEQERHCNKEEKENE